MYIIYNSYSKPNISFSKHLNRQIRKIHMIADLQISFSAQNARKVMHIFNFEITNFESLYTNLVDLPKCISIVKKDSNVHCRAGANEKNLICGAAADVAFPIGLIRFWIATWASGRTETIEINGIIIYRKTLASVFVSSDSFHCCNMWTWINIVFTIFFFCHFVQCTI